MKFSKDLGQVFLKNKNYVRKIIDHLDIQGKKVLEIGAGRGEITKYLIEKSDFVFCIEIDSRLCRILKEKFSSFGNVEIICGDILKIDLQKLGKELIIFGNVPFCISNRIIRYLVSYRNQIYRVYLTFQKEFAKKLVAEPPSKDFSFLSCYIQYYAKVKILFNIPRKAFYPVPKVDSSFVVMEFYPESPYQVDDEKFLFKLIRKAFQNRRKKLINSLERLIDKEVLKESLKATSISEDARVDSISVQDYCKLAAHILRARKHL